METSSNLSLPYLQPSQAQKHVTHNEALQLLDMLVQLSVETLNASTPPNIPANGETHGLGLTPTGSWAGQANTLAYWQGSGWVFVTPQEGWRAWDKSSGEMRIWDGSDWAAVSIPDNNLDGLGIGTSYDVNNRLAVRSPSTLLTNEGAGHQLKINKATSLDTSSLLFQTGWSGRAEMGTAGTDNFGIKVSSDGSTWSTGLEIDSLTGRAVAPSGLDVTGPLGGTAVQQNPRDETTGRVLTVGGFGLGSTLSLAGIDDLNTYPSGFFGNDGAASIPANAPHTSGRSAGFSTHASADAGLQIMHEADIAEGLWVRKKGTGGIWSQWVWVFTQANVVGTVSQLAGAPTGAIIERGSNINGHYTRFADGTQICTQHLSTAATSHNWTFPIAFDAIVAGALTLSATAVSNVAAFVTVASTPTTTSATLLSWLHDGSAHSAEVHVTATGRWF